MFKVNSRNTRTWCEICSKLITKTGVFIGNFDQISYLLLNMKLANGEAKTNLFVKPTVNH